MRTRYEKFWLAASTLLITGEVNAGIPLINLSCTDKIAVHADQGGPVYINGKQAKLKKFKDNHYEATIPGITVLISINADGSTSVSYTRKHGSNGMCQNSESSG
jgi:hypothetical protein